jgi:nucleotide-binding universal stress UspA family protein
MKILFPTDFSKAADHAFIYALKFADKIDGEITTVHVYDIPQLRAAHLPNTMNKVYDSIALGQFENYKDHIPHLREIAAQNSMGHIRLNHSMVENSRHGIVQAIVNEGRKAKADFVIMGTTGASGLKEAFLGSIAAEVLENAVSPVLAVPFKARFNGRIDRIAFTTDYKMEDIGALTSTLNFAEKLGAKVLCVHVDTSHTEPYTTRMHSFMENFSARNNLVWEVIDHVSVEEGLVDFVDDHDIDILAMYVRKRNFIEELFTYSLTKKMANHRRVPIFGLHKSFDQELGAI